MKKFEDFLEESSLNHDTELAIKLMHLANEIGNRTNDIQSLIRTTGHPIKEEREAIDILWESGPKMQQALRALAMRLDRNALGLSQE